MKKFKVMLSVLMVFIIIFVSVAPTFAENAISESRVVISEDLKAVMENSDKDEKIKVYLWYKDIDQDEVDALTTQATGLTPESCEVIEEFPSQELISSLKNDEPGAEAQMKEYMKCTKPARKAERERTDRYSSKRREISNEKYNEKSRNIKNALSISDNDVEFSSQFAPMIIAEMTKNEIETASKNSNIEEISLYMEPKMEEESIESAIKTTNVDKVNNPLYLGLTGDEVKVGIIENGRGIFSTDSEEDLNEDIDNFDDLERIVLDQETPNIIYTDNGGSILDFGNVAVINGALIPDTHANAVAITTLSVAPEAKLYFTNYNFRNIETLISAGVEIFNVSLGDPVKETSSKYAYTDEEKWFDYIIANHGVTVFKSAGNRGNKYSDVYDPETGLFESYGARVTSPGMAYNIIAVGQYKDVLSEDYEITEDSLYYTSSYKNMVEGKCGCEKPDVVMPSSFYGGGTSVASPFLVGTVALLYELKPSISNSPHLVKSIILASCHRKVKQNTEGAPLFISGVQEYIEDGITERQGAGAPDAWTMACIVCQGTYGVGILSGSDTKINIVQPPYGAQNINVSISWLRENTVEDEMLVHVIPENVTEGQVSDINLALYHNDTQIKSSSLSHSSTEMCYVPLDTTDYKYQIRLTDESVAMTNVRYAYAWSTDNMRAAPISQEGVFYIKNSASGRYLTYDTTSGTPQAVHRSVLSQSAFSDIHQWVVQHSGNSYNVLPGYGTTNLYLGQSNSSSATTIPSLLKSVEEDINVLYNDNGTVSFFNSTNDRVLTYSGSSVIWKTYNSTTSTLLNNQKWHLEKVNYLKGDVNADGTISEPNIDNSDGTGSLVNQDVLDFQDYLSEIKSSTNLNMFLADVDGDGVASIMDITRLLHIAESQYNY